MSPDTTTQTPRPEDLVQRVHEAILEVAPELGPELADLDPDADLWTELQLDSMDHLSIMERLSGLLGQEIPEADYGRLLSITAICEYLGGRGT